MAGMDGNRTHPGRLSSAPQTVLKTAGLASGIVHQGPLQFNHWRRQSPTVHSRPQSSASLAVILGQALLIGQSIRVATISVAASSEANCPSLMRVSGRLPFAPPERHSQGRPKLQWSRLCAVHRRLGFAKLAFLLWSLRGGSHQSPCLGSTRQVAHRLRLSEMPPRSTFRGGGTGHIVCRSRKLPWKHSSLLCRGYRFGPCQTLPRAHRPFSSEAGAVPSPEERHPVPLAKGSASQPSNQRVGQLLLALRSCEKMRTVPMAFPELSCIRRGTRRARGLDLQSRRSNTL